MQIFWFFFFGWPLVIIIDQVSESAWCSDVCVGLRVAVDDTWGWEDSVVYSVSHAWEMQFCKICLESDSNQR